MKKQITTLIVAICGLAMPLWSVEHVLPIDLTDHQMGDKVNIKRLDANTVEWALPDGEGQAVVFDLKAKGINLSDYDEFRFDLKPIGSQVGIYLALYHHPAPEQKSGWYLKFPAPEGQWSNGRYDLHLDDDGAYVGKPKKNERPGTMKVKLYKRLLGFPGEPKWRRAQIRNMRLVKRIVSVDFDILKTEIIEDGAEVRCTYQLNLSNKSQKPVRALVNLDGHQTLHYFSAEGPEAVELAAGEKKTVPISVFMSRDAAMALPALYAEPLIPVVSVEGVPDSDVYPMMGYRRWPMWGVVPIFNRKTWSPLFVKALWESRKKGLPAIDKAEQHILKASTHPLSKTWPVPSFAVPGHDQLYRCPECKRKLKQVDETNFHKHHCQGCKKTFENHPIDRFCLRQYHSKRAHNVRSLAHAYLLTGDMKYAKKGIEILLEYAKTYSKMPITAARSTSSGTRLGPSSLHSSYVLPEFAEGYGFLRDAPCLEAKDRVAIESFINESAARIARHSVEYGNQQAEHFRAYGSAGLATGFWPLVAEALYGDFGWHKLVEYGYSEDGIAHEGGVYHNAVFFAMNEFAQYAYSEGANLYTARFKRVYDGTLVAGLVAPGSASFDQPYMVYGEPTYLRMIEGSRKRNMGFYAAMFGPLGVPPANEIKVVSDHLDGAGYVYLRTGNAVENMEIALNYIKYFDRSEYDKFSTFFRRNGRQIDGTVARITYGSKHSHWMYQTAGHNTIVVDGDSQVSLDAAGALVAYDGDAAQPIAAVESDPKAPLYEGVRQLRCIALIDGHYVVADRVTSDQPRTIDRYQWGRGKTKIHHDVASTNNLGHLPKEGYFKEVVGGTVGKSARVDFANGMKMRLIGDGDFDLYKAVTMAGYEARPAEVTFARRAKATSATFVAAFSFGAKAEPPKLELVESSDTALVFKVHGSKTFTVTVKPGAREAKVSAM